MFQSIRNKIILLVILAILVSAVAVQAVSLLFVSKNIETSVNEYMHMVCENSGKELESYFNSVEQSIETLSKIVVKEYDDEDLDMKGHLKDVNMVFNAFAQNTKGAITYFYRLNPDLFDERGIYCIVSPHGTYTTLPLTIIEDYDEDDPGVNWYYVPKNTGEAVWLSPYQNETLHKQIVSYVAPLKVNNTFIGVVGMDIGVDTINSLMEETSIFDSGYAFLLDKENKIIYHPEIESGTLVSDVYENFNGIDNSADYISYKYNGENRRAVTYELKNGMTLVLTAKSIEMYKEWDSMVVASLLISLGIMILFAFVGLMFANRITNPIKNLALAAQKINEGNYDIDLTYKGNDEVGVLTNTFENLTHHLKGYIGDLSNKAYTDSLTLVKNKSMFVDYVVTINNDLKNDKEHIRPFAVLMFDCNNLKEINDEYGHLKGDIYLKTNCLLICRTFRQSPVFRIGGDEFVAVLSDYDYVNMGDLLESFFIEKDNINSKTDKAWEKINIAVGFAIYEPETDSTFEDILNRADSLMYEDKRQCKGDKEVIRDKDI